MGQLFCRSCGFALDLSPAEATTKAVASFFTRPEGSPSAHVPDDDVLTTVVNVSIPAEVLAADADWADGPTGNADGFGAESANDDEAPVSSELPSPSEIALDDVMAAHKSRREGDDGSEDSTIPVPAKMRALAAMAEAAARASSAPGASPVTSSPEGLSLVYQRPTVNVSIAKKASAEPGSRQAEPSPPTTPYGRLVVYTYDSAKGTPFALLTSPFDIGSREGHVRLVDDPYVSPLHARLVLEGGHWYMVDLGSLNGVYRRLAPSVELGDRDLILLGQQVLRFELVMDAERALRPAYQHGVALFGTPPAARFARLCQRTVEGVTRDVVHMGREELTLGREGTDLAFPDDGFLSRRHARLQRDASSGRFTLEDLGSSNGTFVSVRGRVPVRDGDIFRLGLHLVRVEVPAPSGDGGGEGQAAAGERGERGEHAAGEGGSA